MSKSVSLYPVGQNETLAIIWAKGNFGDLNGLQTMISCFYPTKSRFL